MFWDTVAPLYNLFENIYNGSVNKQLQVEVAALIDSDDRVLECACGAGNVIHLLDNPSAALHELERVCKTG